MDTSALEELAQKLGRTMEQLWPIAVRFVVTDALVGIGFVFALWAATFVFARWAWSRLNLIEAAPQGPFGAGPEALLGKAVTVAFVVTIGLSGLHSLFCDISTLANPEGYLVLEVLKRATNR